MKRSDLVRAALVAGGAFYLLTGIALLFAPQWFFDNIGFYPPYNRHYEGDLGAFTIPLGIALLLAARRPARHRSLVAFAFAASLVHALNHLLDDPVVNTLPLFLFAVMLGAAWYFCPPDEQADLRRAATRRT